MIVYELGMNVNGIKMDVIVLNESFYFKNLGLRF